MYLKYNRYSNLESFGHDCTNNNGLTLKIGVLLFYMINGDLYHTVFAGFGYMYLSVYIIVLYTNIDLKNLNKTSKLN